MSWRITFIGSTNFLCFPAATGRRPQPPSFSGYYLREDPTPQLYGYNQKEATTPYVLRLQPLVRAPSNHPEIEIPNVDNLSLTLNQSLPLSTCHCQHVPITCNNLYQLTCTKQLVPITWTNMHHASTMHQLHIIYDSSICTNIINYTPHVCVNSSTTCLNHVPNMYLNHIAKTYTNITIKNSSLYP